MAGLPGLQWLAPFLLPQSLQQAKRYHLELHGSSRGSKLSPRAQLCFVRNSTRFTKGTDCTVLTSGTEETLTEPGRRNRHRLAAEVRKYFTLDSLEDLQTALQFRRNAEQNPSRTLAGKGAREQGSSVHVSYRFPTRYPVTPCPPLAPAHPPMRLVRDLRMRKWERRTRAWRPARWLDGETDRDQPNMGSWLHRRLSDLFDVASTPWSMQSQKKFPDTFSMFLNFSLTFVP